MKNPVLKHVPRAFGRAVRNPRLGGLAVLVTTLLATANLTAAPLVDTLTGGPSQFSPPYSGYEDGDTAAFAQFNSPMGLALDVGANYLYVADRDNNAVRVLDLAGNLTDTLTTDGINRPVGVAVDDGDNVHVLNRGNGFNGSVLVFDWFGYPVATNAVGLTNANGLALDELTNAFVTIESNKVIKITPAGVITTVATLTNAGTLLRGIAVMSSGSLAVCDSGRHGILLINPATGVVTTNTGFNGAGDAFGAKAHAKFNQPYGIAAAGAGMLVVTDFGNHRVKVVDSLGTVTNLYGVHSNYWVTGQGSFPGWWDGTVVRGDLDYNILGTVEARSPAGVLFAGAGTVYTTETYYHLIRKTESGLPAIPPPPPPPPPVPAPRIGWVDFPPTDYLSLLKTDQPFIFHNDVIIAIDGTEGAETHFTFGVTGSGIPNPDETTGSTPPPYWDDMFRSQVPPTLLPTQPDVTVKAVGVAPDRQSSYVVTARFQFKTANPVIMGNNAALFTVSDQTTNAVMWYTTDGVTDPTPDGTNSIGPVIGPVISPATLSFNISSNITFKIRAFRDNYQPSDVVSQTFSATNFNANKITFGFGGGEASSDFIASPGQLFYAPVTLSVLPDQEMYSLQFNITVTNLDAAPALNRVDGYLHFESMLEKPDPNNPGLFLRIPPATFFGQVVGRVSLTNLDGTISLFPLYVPQQTDPPPTNQIIAPWYYNFTMPFLDLRFVNSTNNLIGVGWLERQGKTNLYNTLVQDLIKYSQPHDTLFEEKDGKVVLGGYAFRVPTNAATGDQYKIEIGRPSATSDGVGAPGSDVYIATPTNGPIKSLQTVTAGQRKYVVGDVAPFRWFNAGDFGNTNGSAIVNDDVMQVFQSTIYGLNSPPPGSDFEDGMNSCCGTIVPVAGTDFFVKATDITGTSLNDLFNGDDTLIDSIGFGDGNLDVTDVYVTFRRALDPSLQWFQRFWTNGVRAAQFATNQFRVAGSKAASKSSSGGKDGAQTQSASSESPAVTFVAGDAVGAAGQTLQIPITARIRGSYPIRVLALNLTVQPLDGSPALTQAIQFWPAPSLGQPTMSDSKHAGNYTAAWLNSGIIGLAGSNVVVGVLTVTVPANAPGIAAYAIHFDHASASPNGIAPFAQRVQTGLITLADRSASTWADGIPDSWRLRHFGSINNVLSAASGDADGDGAPNSHEYGAGTDPNDNSSQLKLNSSKNGTAPECVVRWPSVAGKHYVIEAAPALFSPNWIPVSTNTGTGWDLEYRDSNVSGRRFYRVRVQE